MGEPRSQPLVLIADDDHNLRLILALFLRNAGYATVDVPNGREALRAAKERKPDVAVLDMNMPLMDGLAVCRALKEDPGTRHLPVVLCTARNRKEDLVGAIKAGAEDYLLKPFTKDGVLAKVAHVLQARSPRPPAGAPSESDRRDIRKRTPPWALSWGGTGQGGLVPVYKTKVLDIALHGLSFEFARCGECTGYEQGTVHSLCLFAKHSKRFPEGASLDFVLSLTPDTVFDVQGKIAHVFQGDDPRIEKVGVVFTSVPPATQEAIRRYIEETR